METLNKSTHLINMKYKCWKVYLRGQRFVWFLKSLLQNYGLISRKNKKCQMTNLDIKTERSLCIRRRSKIEKNESVYLPE